MQLNDVPKAFTKPQTVTFDEYIVDDSLGANAGEVVRMWRKARHPSCRDASYGNYSRLARAIDNNSKVGGMEKFGYPSFASQGAKFTLSHRKSPSRFVNRLTNKRPL